jgi:hypothetical protein
MHYVSRFGSTSVFRRLSRNKQTFLCNFVLVLVAAVGIEPGSL